MIQTINMYSIVIRGTNVNSLSLFLSLFSLSRCFCEEVQRIGGDGISNLTGR